MIANVSRESHRSTSIHAQAIQQSSRMLRAGPYRVDDVAGAISGKHRPRMGEQPAYRVKTLVDSREERSGCRPALATVANRIHNDEVAQPLGIVHA